MKNGVYYVLNFIPRFICVASSVVVHADPYFLTQEFQTKNRQAEIVLKF